jgi:hypothetical protein
MITLVYDPIPQGSTQAIFTNMAIPVKNAVWAEKTVIMEHTNSFYI